MITSLNEWKRSKGESVNEIAVPTSNQIDKPNMNNVGISEDELSHQKAIYDVAMYAKDFGMSKSDTIGMVQKIFVDPSQAPDDISVSFVQNNLGEIVNILDGISDEEYSENPLTFTTDMEKNDLPFECVMYIPDNAKIKQLSEVLNKQIQKKEFKSIYENNIFFINSLEKMNDNNRTIVMNILNECKAKNISNQLKWKRKL